MLLDNFAERGKQAWHIFAADPGSASWIEDRFQLLYHEGNVPAPPENRADHAGKSDRPGVMFEIFGVDENLKWPAPVSLDRVVDSDVDSVIGAGPFELVGKAGKHRVACQRIYRRLRDIAGNRRCQRKSVLGGQGRGCECRLGGK